DQLPYDKVDADKSRYVDQWKELAEACDVDEFMLIDNEKRTTAKVIAEVAHKLNNIQIIIGQTPQNRWEEITKGSSSNALLRELSFVDIHIVSIDRTLRGEEDGAYERGVRAFLRKDEDGEYYLSFTRSKDNYYEG